MADFFLFSCYANRPCSGGNLGFVIFNDVDRSEGRTVAIEYRWVEGREKGYVEVAIEFVRLKVDVIVTSATPAVMTLKEATDRPGRDRASGRAYSI
jgi:hypothetical protein